MGQNGVWEVELQSVVKTGSENGSIGSKRPNWVKKTVKNDMSFLMKQNYHSADKTTRRLPEDHL